MRPILVLDVDEVLNPVTRDNPGRDIVWVDDDCLDLCRMAPGPLTDDSEALYLVAPEVGVGLTPDHIQEIRQWLQSRGHKGTP